MGNADKVMRVRELEIAIRLYGEQIEGLEEMIPFADTHGARGRVRGLYWRNQAQKYRETVAEARTTIAAAQSELAALRADPDVSPILAIKEFADEFDEAHRRLFGEVPAHERGRRLPPEKLAAVTEEIQAERERRRLSETQQDDLVDVYLEDGQVDWAELFGADLSDDELVEIEGLFGAAAWATLHYLKRWEVQAMPSKSQAGLLGFGMWIAKAEFSLRYRPERDRAEVEAWLGWQMEMISTSLASYSGSGHAPPDEDLIAWARQLVEDGWWAICFLVNAMLAPSVDVEGREVQFLRDTFGDPSEYAEVFADNVLSS